MLISAAFLQVAQSLRGGKSTRPPGPGNSARSTLLPATPPPPLLLSVQLLIQGQSPANSQLPGGAPGRGGLLWELGGPRSSRAPATASFCGLSCPAPLRGANPAPDRTCLGKTPAPPPGGWPGAQGYSVRVPGGRDRRRRRHPEGGFGTVPQALLEQRFSNFGAQDSFTLDD